MGPRLRFALPTKATRTDLVFVLLGIGSIVYTVVALALVFLHRARIIA